LKNGEIQKLTSIYLNSTHINGHTLPKLYFRERMNDKQKEGKVIMGKDSIKNVQEIVKYLFYIIIIMAGLGIAAFFLMSFIYGTFIK